MEARSIPFFITFNPASSPKRTDRVRLKILLAKFSNNDEKRKNSAAKKKKIHQFRLCFFNYTVS
jgi:hypothetical protein